MGASLSSNSASMLTDVYNSSTETTNIINTNKNNNVQSVVMVACDLYASDDVNITQSVKQSQNIQQQSTVQNEQVDSNAVNQNLLQSAQSSVSGWGIGVAAAQNNMNVAASISNSMQDAINISNTNVNNSWNEVTCVDSTIVSGGSINISQSNSQSIAAQQVADTSQMQAITNTVSQTASQTATATVSGINLVGLIVAVVVLIIVVAVVLKAVSSKMSKASGSLKGGSDFQGSSLKGGSLYPLSKTEMTVYVWSMILVIILAVIGGLGFKERDNLQCDFDSQCQTTGTSSQFWFSTENATCSCSGRESCGADPKPKSIPTLVAPPLFMCNGVQSDVGFGAASEYAGLYPGSLQYMMVSKVLSNVTATNPMRNNNGYNIGVYSQLLNMAESDVPGATDTKQFITALTDYMQRQVLTLSTVTGKPLIVTPDGSTSLNNWCPARIVQNLLPIQPTFAAPEPGYDCTCANTGSKIDPTSSNVCGTVPTSTLRTTRLAAASAEPDKRSRMVRDAAAKRQARLPRGRGRKSMRLTGRRTNKHKGRGGKRIKHTNTKKVSFAAGLRNAVRMVRAKEAAKKAAEAKTQRRAVAKRMFQRKQKPRKREPQKQKPRKAALTDTGATGYDCSLSVSSAGTSGDIQNSSGAFASSGVGNTPSGFNLFSNVCYKSTGIAERPYIFKVPSACPSDTCNVYPSDGTSMVMRVRVLDGGSNYSSGTTASVSGGGGWLAAVDVHVDANGAVEGVSVKNGGTGFTSHPSINFANTGGGKGAVVTAELGTLCLDKTNTNKLCSNPCGNGDDGWTALPRMQGEALGGGSTCSDTGNSAGTMDSMFTKNGLWAPGQATTSNSMTRCYVAAGTGDGGYGADLNQNKLYAPECATTDLNTAASSTYSQCQFRAIDRQLGGEVPIWMANYTGVVESAASSFKPITVGVGLTQAQANIQFFADLHDVVDSTTPALPSACQGDDCAGEWDLGTGQGHPNPTLAGALGLANPYCNVIAGLCQRTDPSRADYDPDCPPEQQANSLFVSGAETNYESTCAQQPISGCGLYTINGMANPASSAARVCSTSSKGHCWSRALCNAVDGTWTLDSRNGGYYCSDSPTCPAKTLYNSDVGGGECMNCTGKEACEATTFDNSACEAGCASIGTQSECDGGPGGENTAGKKNSADQPCKCAWAGGACSATVDLPRETGCQWKDGTGCVVGCLPDDNICDNCGSDGCAAPCTWSGMVNRIVVTDPGEGYDANTTATIYTDSGVGGKGAEATVSVTTGAVTAVAVTAAGSGYLNAPTVTINSGSGGENFAGTAVVVNGVVQEITIQNGGINYGTKGAVTVSLTGTSGWGFSATVQTSAVDVSNGSIQGFTILDGGAGYGPVVSFSGGGGVGARAAATVSGGKITGITMLDFGSDYTSEPAVTISGAGKGAKAMATFQGGTISAVTVTNTGSGYPVGTDSSVSGVRVKFTSGSGSVTKSAKAEVISSGSCFLGVNVCDADQEAAQLDKLFVVRIPGSFLADGGASLSSANAQDVINFGCLPNVFIPDVANATGQTFLGNCSTIDGYQEKFRDARTCCQPASTAQTVAAGYKDIMRTTCVSKSGALKEGDTPSLKDDYTCGCLTLREGEYCYGDAAMFSDNTTTKFYSANDMLCFVNFEADMGGFILRKADTFLESVNGTKVNGIYTTTASSPSPDLYNYVAEPSTNIVTWEQMNQNSDQLQRLSMFIRILYWLILTTGVGEQELSQLGLSTFVNNLGYDSSKMTPNVFMTSDGISDADMYATQPLLVWDTTGAKPVPKFFTLQELKEGIVDVSAGVLSSQRTAVVGADDYLKQLTMWCYSPSVLGVSGNIASAGFNIATAERTSSDVQLTEAGNLRGLMYGSLGYCEGIWFVSNAFVGATLGIACLLFAILVVYAVVKNVQHNKK